mgnify:CR=1 FL=1
MAVRIADTIAPMGDFPAVMAEDVNIVLEDNSQKSLQDMYEDGELGGGGVSITEHTENDIENNIYKLVVTSDSGSFATPNLMQGVQEVCNAVEEIMNSYTGVTEV